MSADRQRMLQGFRESGLMSLDAPGIERSFTRLTLTIAAVAAVGATAAWIIGGDAGILAIAIGASSVVLSAGVMVRTGRPSALLILGLSALGLSAAGGFTELAAVAAFASITVVFVGIAAVVFIDERVAGFLVGYSLFLVIVHLIWLGASSPALVEGALTVLAFVAGFHGVRWVRDSSLDSASRFLNLFDRAPVSLWEEDFSRVGSWLDRLRAEGVVDLRAYLEQNPEKLLEGMSLVEVVRVNHAAARFLEVDDPSDLVGPLIPETFSVDAYRSMLSQFEAIWRGQDQMTVEVRHGFTVQGNPLYGLLHWTAPRRFGRTDLSRVIVSVVDITEMNRARRDLEDSLRSKEELIATVSHELRTPLTTVVGLSSELSDAFDSFTREEVVDLLAMISDQSNEVATIVEDLLVAARAESGSLKVSVEPVDLHFEAKTTLRGLEIEQDFDCHAVGVIPVVLGDSGRVRQVLRNLIVNARRYGTPPYRVVVLEQGDLVCVEVRDGGSPIPEDERKRIFDRYYKARQTPGMTASVGLGLTVSRELARLMGGDLTYHHDGESVFTLVLPRPVAPEAAESA